LERIGRRYQEELIHFIIVLIDRAFRQSTISEREKEHCSLFIRSKTYVTSKKTSSSERINEREITDRSLHRLPAPLRCPWCASPRCFGCRGRRFPIPNRLSIRIHQYKLDATYSMNHHCAAVHSVRHRSPFKERIRLTRLRSKDR